MIWSPPKWLAYRRLLEVRSQQEGAIQELRAVQDSGGNSRLVEDAGLEPEGVAAEGRAAEEAIRSVTQQVGRAPSEQEIAKEMELTLAEYQLLLGDLKGFEIGSLHVERSEDSGDEELAYIPGSTEEDPLFRV